MHVINPEKLLIIHKNKTHVFGVIADNKDVTNSGHRTINYGLQFQENLLEFQIRTPFSKMLQVLQMLPNAEAISQRRLLEEKEMNTFE